MRKFLIGFILVTISSLSLYGQQEAQFSQNMFNLMALNPGYAGANDAICATSLFRQQWTGFQDPDGSRTSPQTILLSLDAPIRLLGGGLGLTISQDEIGFEKNLGVKLSYAYHLPIGMGRLQIGAQASFLDKSIDFTKFKPLQTGDPLLMGQGQSNITTDFAFGAYYQVPGRYYAGIASTQLSEATIEDQVSTSAFALKRHYFIMGGYSFMLPSNPSFVIKPSVLIKTDFAAAQYDVNGLVEYNSRFWGGLSYRVQDAVVIILGFVPVPRTIPGLKIGYSYDLTTSPLGAEGRSSGSHEIMLNYCFNIIIKHPTTEYHNSRLFDDR